MVTSLLLSIFAFLLALNPAPASDYKVLAPIRHGNLTVFPVVATISRDTREFLTLDEGLRSGEVVVTEAGRVSTMIRRPMPLTVPQSQQAAQVNRLVLVNNSKRPLLLLAGEIVTGGKQDRVIAKDRLVAPESDPLDLSVFCVEHGRWEQTSSKFGLLGTTMAAPAVRSRAMGDKDQAKVWSEVQKARTAAITGMAEAGSVSDSVEVQNTTSYARVMENKTVQKQLDSVAAPIESSYRSLMKELRDRSAVGVVVAVNGEIIWADIFASTELLQKYWSKLVRSYAAETLVSRAKGGDLNEKAAQTFLEKLEGQRETVESESGLYRYTERAGEGFRAFELTTLLPKTGWNLHIAKMTE